MDDDVLDRLYSQWRDVRRVDPQPPRHPRTGDKAPLLNDRIGPRSVRVMEKQVTPGTCLKLPQCHG